VTTYPKRLIEVDLPIKRISEHARREKYVGTITSLHLWWARRPLAACRSVICAALWPDPADPHCPTAFRVKALAEMLAWTPLDRQKLLSVESCKRFEAARQKPALFKNPVQLRGALLDFIADFANWDNSTVREYLDSSRALTIAAHESLGGAPGTRPLVVDPFAGGGSIPLEALRVGADAFASDLNPVAVLLNKVVLEYIPKYGQRLADELRKWGEWIKHEADQELAEFYPKDSDGATPIAYLWARTIQCEGPGCGAKVPLIRSLWLAKKSNCSIALQLMPRPKAKCVDFKIIIKQRDGWVDQNDPKIKIADPTFDGTAKRGSATCPCCGYTTPVARVRAQLCSRKGGTLDAQLLCLVTTRGDEAGRFYRIPTLRDTTVLQRAAQHLKTAQTNSKSPLSYLPDEATPTSKSHRAVGSLSIYGMSVWADVFTPRQALTLASLVRLTKSIARKSAEKLGPDFSRAAKACISLAVSREADHLNSACSWNPSGQKMQHLFARQALPMVWDFCEANPLGDSVGSWSSVLDCVVNALERCPNFVSEGHAELASATSHPLPDDAATALVTDPPYYDSVPYGELADFFYVWLRRMLLDDLPNLFRDTLTPKKEQLIVWHPSSEEEQRTFETKMHTAMTEGRRVLAPQGIGLIVFAHKSTKGWESQLQAMIDGGWIITGSWPIDTELGTRVNAQGTASLSSSIHLVCRPRETPDDSARTDEIGDWRDVLQELPRRIHEWMPRLAEEGVVGADAIFACLGPALEIFSRYSRVEKASGEAITLKEYLEQVWAAVAKEALTMVFQGADATGFEADARLTAMWLWTLQAGDANDSNVEITEEDEANEEPQGGAKKTKTGGFVLEYDAARKIAQGLGARLEDLESLVEVSGEQARLLSVGERARHLFGKDEGRVAPQRKKREPQMDLFKVLEQTDGKGMPFGETKVEHQGATVLDRIHQSMILFAAGRGEALKRFLVEDGAGRDQRFWHLAQALSALYPSHIEEKRWVDGVLARKKGLGF